MFYLHYLLAELRRRPGRTALTALGLAVGVGLVVIVGALSAGLDDAQDEVLEPLTGVGTDMTANRPISFEQGEAGIAGPGGLSGRERQQLERENGPRELDFNELGDPGERFERDEFISTELSFPESEARRVERIAGVEATSPALTVELLHIEGRVPDTSSGPRVFGGPPPGGGERSGGFGLSPTTVTGIDPSRDDLGLVRAEQVSQGRFLRPGDADGAMLSRAYADQNGLQVGDEVEVGKRRLEVVGIVSAPVGGDPSNIYMQLGTLQAISDREGRVNQLQVRADEVDAVETVASRIESAFAGSEVTTARDLSERISGSLVNAKDLSDKLGLGLAIVALAAAFLIASLLALGSINKRTRELGTLKALGWGRRLVIRQVTGESLAQGLLGGACGALIGIAGAALVGALGISLEASAGADAPTGPGPIAAFGPDRVVEGSSTVTLGAPVDPGLLLLAVGLALLGGLIAGAAGGLRVARLRPAEALRSAE